MYGKSKTISGSDSVVTRTERVHRRIMLLNTCLNEIRRRASSRVSNPFHFFSCSVLKVSVSDSITIICDFDTQRPDLASIIEKKPSHLPVSRVIYRHTSGTPMGSPSSPFIADIFKETFRNRV